MARTYKRLTALQVNSIKTNGRHADGGGLYLSVSGDGARRSWLFLYNWQGRRREAGLGKAGPGGLSLAEARQRADVMRRQVREGVDPIAERARQQQEAAPFTFGQVLDEVLETYVKECRNPKHRAQWRSTLHSYAEPLLNQPVDRIDTEAVLRVLKPIWAAKPETASRVRGRIERVFNVAKTKGLRSGENPAAWRGHLENLLPKRAKLSRGHHAAYPWQEMSRLIAALKNEKGLAALCLRWVILSACRSGEARGARWDEIDREARVWIIPAARTKTGEEHRVPVTEPMLAILTEVEPLCRTPSDLVFPGGRSGRPLSDVALTKVLRRLHPKATVHGMRSSFRDWAGEMSHHPREVCEAALAHVIANKAEAAYRRGDALEKRRLLMSDWASWCCANTT